MVSISLIVPHIALEFSFGTLTLCFFLLEIGVFLFFFIEIAFVIATCGWAMILPISHTNPTKFVSALRARHVVAALVFLDILLALGADFRVCWYPVNILWLGIRLLIPHFGCMTITRFMRVLSTHEAKLGSALAGNIVKHAAHVLSLATVIALHVWAPLDISIVVSERFAEPLPVGLFVLWWACQHRLEYWVSNFHVAATLHTTGVDALESALNLSL